jgi:hypothetical protein
MHRPILAALTAFLLLSPALAAELPAKPSRTNFTQCQWQKVSDTDVGLAAWVMQCEYGDRKIDLRLHDHALWEHYSEGEKPQSLVEVIPLAKGEDDRKAITRHFRAHTDAKLAARCVLAPSPEKSRRPGVSRYTFVPDTAYAKEVRKNTNPDEVGEPPCGDFGESPDGIAYYEAQAGSGAVLYVVIGQDDPLFDQDTLTVLTKP